jgi:hypothetical protein
VIAGGRRRIGAHAPRHRVVAWLFVLVAIVVLAVSLHRVGLVALPFLGTRSVPVETPPSFLNGAEDLCRRGTGAVIRVEGPDIPHLDVAPPPDATWSLTSHGGDVVRIVAANAPGSREELFVQLRYGLTKPERTYAAGPVGSREGWIMVGGGGVLCDELVRGGGYTITSFPRPGEAGDLRVQFHVQCAGGVTMAGCVQVEGQPVRPWSPPPAPAPESGATGGSVATGPSTEPPAEPQPEASASAEPKDPATGEKELPLDALPDCSPWQVSWASQEPGAPPASGGIEYLGSYLNHRDDPVYDQLPSVLRAQALAREHFQAFGVEAPIPAKYRPNLARNKRVEVHYEGGPGGPPPVVGFDAPARAVPGHFYVFGPQGAAEAKVLGARGWALLEVTVNGCEVGERRALAAVHLASPDGALFWSPAAVPLGRPEPISPAKALRVRKDQLQQHQLVFTVGGKQRTAPAGGPKIESAYRVPFAGKPHLAVAFRNESGRKYTEVCSLVVLYEIGADALRPVGALSNQECGVDGTECLPCVDQAPPASADP